MGLKKKLEDWKHQNFLTDEQVQTIQAYEETRSRSLTQSTVSGLGIAIIVMGALLMVGANWWQISDTAKILGGFFLQLLCCWAIVRAVEKQRSSADHWLALFSGLVLAMLGLIAQIYHLGGTISGLCLFWCAVVAPIMMHYQRTAFWVVWGAFLTFSLPDHWQVSVLVFSLLYAGWLFLYQMLDYSKRLPHLARGAFFWAFYGGTLIAFFNDMDAGSSWRFPSSQRLPEELWIFYGLLLLNAGWFCFREHGPVGNDRSAPCWLRGMVFSPTRAG